MSGGQTIKTWTFQLSSIQAASTQGADVNFSVPGNVSLTNASNQFVAYLSEASIPKYNMPIASFYNNNTFTYKLQGYVEKAFENASASVNPWISVGKWMDCTDIQKTYVDPYLTGIYLNAPYTAVWATPANNTSYPNQEYWCDNQVVTIPNGVYTTQLDLASAVNTQWGLSIATVNGYFNRPATFGIFGGNYFAGPQSTSGSPSFTTFTPNWNFTSSITPTGVANVTVGKQYVVLDLGSTSLAQWQAVFSTMAVLPTVGATYTATATGTIVGGGLVFLASGTTNNWSLQTKNCFGWFSQLPVTSGSNILFSGHGVFVLKYRIYVYANEICSMLGFGDQDFVIESPTLTEAYTQKPLAPFPTYPNFWVDQGTNILTSPYLINLYPNTTTYITCSSLTSQNAFISAPIIYANGKSLSNGQLINSLCLGTVYTDENSSISRTNVYYSLPLKYFILDKVVNVISLTLKDYRNRPIPIAFFGKPFFITLVIEEVSNINATTQSMTLSQLNDIESAFFQEKELELQYQFEQFIRNRR